jgi:hypothetical protein
MTTSPRRRGSAHEIEAGGSPSKKTERYRWNGSRIVADGDPPLAYGKHGDKVHPEPGG